MKIVALRSGLRFVLIAFALLLALSTPSLAGAEAQYNFASAQGSSSLTAVPGGEEAQGLLYFYNVDGNRITHIILRAVDVPEGWEVTIDPALEQRPYTVGDASITVLENVAVEPSEVSPTEITNPPAGFVVLELPNKLGPNVPGYALAKQVNIFVKIPKATTYGSEKVVKISGEASWLGQSGTAEIRIPRDFTFSVKAVYPNEMERPATAKKGFDIGRWIPAIAAVAIVAVGAVLLPRISKKKS